MVAMPVMVKWGGFFGGGISRMRGNPSSSRLEKAGIPMKKSFRRNLNSLLRFQVTC
jgi:hypothetical protein